MSAGDKEYIWKKPLIDLSKYLADELRVQYKLHLAWKRTWVKFATINAILQTALSAGQEFSFCKAYRLYVRSFIYSHGKYLQKPAVCLTSEGAAGCPFSKHRLVSQEQLAGPSPPSGAIPCACLWSDGDLDGPSRSSVFQLVCGWASTWPFKACPILCYSAFWYYKQPAEKNQRLLQ